MTLVLESDAIRAAVAGLRLQTRALIGGKTADSGVWSRMSPANRKKVLVKFADLIDAHTAELAAEAGLPEGVLNVVPGPGESVGEAIARHKEMNRGT